MAIFTESRGWSRAWSRGHVVIFTEVTRLFLNLHDVFLLQNRPLGASLATSMKNACSSLFEKWRKTGPEMSTISGHFGGRKKKHTSKREKRKVFLRITRCNSARYQHWKKEARNPEPLFKINIYEGEGGKIMANWTSLTCFTDRSIAPMFSWIFPTPKRINP